jgi:hypothetical protein
VYKRVKKVLLEEAKRRVSIRRRINILKGFFTFGDIPVLHIGDISLLLPYSGITLLHFKRTKIFDVIVLFNIGSILNKNKSSK